jgi:hypothetical protein
VTDTTGFPRVALGPVEAFEREYFLPLRPAVITNLFDGEAVRALRSQDDVLAAWGHVRIPLNDDYDTAIAIAPIRAQVRARSGVDEDLAAATEVPLFVSVAGYFALISATRGSVKPRVVFEPPRDMHASFRLPAVCHSGPCESPALATACLVGTAGSFSQLHFDKDGTHGLLYQVYGRKRVVVIPPSSSRKLAPLAQFSGWCLQSFTEEDRIAFLRYVDGVETVLQPGDAAYLPAFCWHFVDYLDDCWSINVRFRRARSVTILLNEMFPNIDVQAIGVRMIGDPAFAAEVLSRINDMPAATRGRERVAAMRRLAGELNTRGQSAAPQRTYFPDLETTFPAPLPHFSDANDPNRPQYS